MGETPAEYIPDSVLDTFIERARDINHHPEEIHIDDPIEYESREFLHNR
jgi:hypothetical protein